MHDNRYYCSKACQLQDWAVHKQYHKALDKAALIDLASEGDWKGVQKMLRAGADPLATDDQGMTALDHASCLGYFKVVKLLVDSIEWSSEAIMSVRDSAYLAYQEGQFFIVEVLIKAGGKKLLFGDDPSQEIFSLLHEAALDGHLDLIKLLVKIGGESLLLLQPKGFGTCLHTACGNGNLEVVELLVNAGGDTLLMQPTNSPAPRCGYSCLHIAAITGHLDIFKFLVQSGGKKLLHMEGQDGITCLHVAAHNSRRSIVKFILAEAGKEFARRPIRSGRMAGKFALDMARGDGYVGTTCSCCEPLSAQQAVCEDLIEAELALQQALREAAAPTADPA
jgi:ankyrin repeat protein